MQCQVAWKSVVTFYVYSEKSSRPLLSGRDGTDKYDVHIQQIKRIVHSPTADFCLDFYAEPKRERWKLRVKKIPSCDQFYR